MRLHRVEIEGFGPFRARQRVDFDRFSDEGLFLIAGRTGAGKSSILDAICFALYGSVPRYADAARRLRSDHSEVGEASEVVLEFSTPAGRWRITRAPEYERPKARGEGTTLQAATVQLDLWRDGAWTGIASRERTVAEELQTIVQLTKEQFLQTILLAQNRFARFLLAKNDERQRLLRTLFGTRRFEEYERLLDERRKALSSEVSEGEARLRERADEAEAILRDLLSAAQEEKTEGTPAVAPDAVPAQAAAKGDRSEDAIPGRLAAIDGARAVLADAARRAREHVETTLALLRAAESERDARAELRDAQQRRDAARERSRLLAEQQADVSEAARERDLARAAAVLREPLRAVERAEEALADARERERSARERMASFPEAADALSVAREDTDTVEPVASLLAEQIGVLAQLEEARKLEATTEQRREEEQRLAAAEQSARNELRDREEEATALPGQIAELRTRIDALQSEAGELALREKQLSEAREICAAAVDARAKGVELDAARAKAAQAGLAVEQAWARYNELNLARLRGAAGVLAAELVPGEPCQVCGSTEHPHPALERDEVVSDDDVEHAALERDRAIAAHRDADEEVSLAARAREIARERARGLTVEDAEQRRAVAQKQLSGAQDALASQNDARRRLREREARTEEVSRESRGLRERLAAAGEALAAFRERERLTRERIDAARGEHASVEERATRAQALRDAAQALIDATASRAHSRRAHADALATCAEALATSHFGSSEEARAALRSPEQISRLDERVRAHEAETLAVRQLLAELEARQLPEEPLDVAGAERAVDELRERWRADSLRAEALAGGRERIDALRNRIADEHDRLAEAIAEKDAAERLANTVAGRAPNTRRMSLESYVLAAELEDIVDAANVTLADMSDGRYRLVHSDALARHGGASGLGIDVYDAYTGAARPAQSLSGGETFLASLALALGLADVVTARAGGIRLDTLFVDEGFGSLDSETLEVAMRVLDGLRQGGRTVGVISHVEAMQEQILGRITVERGLNGPSVIRDEGG